MAATSIGMMQNAVPSCPARPRAFAVAHGRTREQRRQLHVSALPRVQASTTALVEFPAAQQDSLDPADAARRRLLEASFDADAAEEPATFASNVVVAQRPASSLQEGGRAASHAGTSTSGRLDEGFGSSILVPSTRSSQRVRRTRPTAISRRRSASPDPPAKAGSRQTVARGSTALAHRRLKRRRATEQGRVAPAAAPSCTAPAPEGRHSRAVDLLAGLRERLGNARIATSSSRSEDAIQRFMRSVASISILSREEEAQLCAIIHLGKQLDRAAADIVAEQELAEGDEPAEVSDEALAARLGLKSALAVEQRRENAKEAKDLMVQYNMRLVVAIASKYLGRGVELSDLIPEGTVGLEKAIERFDASKGFKFSTYAHWWIRQAVSRCITEQSRVVRLPVHVYDHVAKINKVTRSLSRQPGRTQSVTYAEIGKVLGMPAAKVKQYVQATRDPKSLHAPLHKNNDKNTGNGESLVDTLAAEESDDEDAVEHARTARASVDQLLSTLHPRERNVLRFRYGILQPTDGMMTLNDIGKLYDLKGERIRQIELRALSRLRRPERLQALQHFQQAQRQGTAGDQGTSLVPY